MEPMVKLGYWTNGSSSLAIYKQHTNDWLQIESPRLPQPDDDLTRPPLAPLTWNSLRLPTEVELSAALKRFVATIVVQDARATRREDQLRQLLHVMLEKLDNDAYFSLPVHADEPIQIRGRRQFRHHPPAAIGNVLHRSVESAVVCRPSGAGLSLRSKPSPSRCTTSIAPSPSARRVVSPRSTLARATITS